MVDAEKSMTNTPDAEVVDEPYSMRKDNAQ